MKNKREPTVREFKLAEHELDRLTSIRKGNNEQQYQITISIIAGTSNPGITATIVDDFKVVLQRLHRDNYINENYGLDIGIQKIKKPWEK